MIRKPDLTLPSPPQFFSHVVQLLQDKDRPNSSRPAVSSAPPKVHARAGAIEVLDPKFDLSKIKVIIWDMDGTLYSQNPMLFRYRDAFSKTFSEPVRKIFDEKSQEVIQGTSLFKVGHSYDPRYKLILDKNHRGEIVHAYDLKGRSLPEAAIKRLYPQPIKGDEGIIHIDNKIKALEVLGVSLGKTMKEADGAYFAVRNDYFDELKGQNPSPGLPEFLSALQKLGYLHLIATAAPVDGAKEMLHHLKIVPHLHRIHGGVSKPHGMQMLVKEIMKEHGVSPDQILSIGNESAMDLVIPKRLGVQTLLIEGDPGQNLEGADAKVPSLKALMQSLQHFENQAETNRLSSRAA